jgi:aconitate hydratase
MSRVATTAELVRTHYETLDTRLQTIREALGHPLSLAEKILYSHLDQEQSLKNIKKGESFLMLRPDRVAMQDATAQMAILQFIQSGKKQVAVPTTTHCDHLIRAHEGVESDMVVANKENQEVFNFLKSSSQKYGLGFWGPGSGIIHQVVLENYAFPGGLMIGTDSHTPNAGGLGMCAVGVGGADAVDVMAGFAWEVKSPKLIGVRLTGKLSGWASSKDVILKLCGLLTVKGGTNKIVEYFGPGCETISCTGKGTICNMGAELGATCSVFPYDERMQTYLNSTDRSELAELADRFKVHLCADAEVEANPHKFYDQVVEINLSELEPHIVGPHSPDTDRGISTFAQEIKEKKYPETISAALIGSCTNSSYEDICRATEVVRSALAQGLKSKCQFMISPGSSQIFETIKRDGLLKDLEAFGGTVLANACGPCIGQWKRKDLTPGMKNSIVTSFNRNFKGRNDSNAETLAFISSPELVVAYAASGSLRFNPIKDQLTGSKGSFKLAEPRGPELPKNGFVSSNFGYIEPSAEGSSTNIEVKEDSERLQLLQPFSKWEGGDFEGHLILTKTLGKTTTDHISPAGKWLRFRGHLDNISNNMYLGASNAFTGEVGKGLNVLSGQKGQEFSATARDYKAKGKRWVVIGDENFGEGSSREHAAMSPRFLGASTILVRSFARIHETNLKKQGILALTFVDKADYERINEEDLVSVKGLKNFAPDTNLTVEIKHQNGNTESFEVQHSFNAEQIQWFKAGSALNLIKD